MIGSGSATEQLSAEIVRQLLARAFDATRFDDQRVLVIIPDGTRSAPIPLMFRLLYEVLGKRVERLDYLIALGTHPPMSEAAIERLVGVSAADRARDYPKTQVFNHRWDLPDALTTIGLISGAEMARISGGMVSLETPVTLNKMIFDYDDLIICGPVFPHEVAGFSGGAKYLFPGIAAAEIINNTHWLGALSTSMATIGVKDTAVRRVLHRAAEFVTARRPLTVAAMVLKGHDLHGLYIGNHLEAWEAASDLSAQLNIRYLDKPMRTVLSMPAKMYDDLWTAAKATYKTEPVVADGGEVIIYAPHLIEISFSHGDYIRRVGYHVKDYFLKQWDQFTDIPLSILAHSTHVRGNGVFEGGVERPRIQVTLATGIPEEVCRRINLGYRNPATLNPADYANREDEGVLLVENAGEYLFRLADRRH